MNSHQHRSDRYPNLLVTVKQETEERSVTETYSNPRKRRSKNNHRSTYIHPTTIYYNSNHRQTQHFTRSPPSTVRRHSQNYDRLQYHNYQQPIRPLMEIRDNHFYFHHDVNDNDIDYLPFQQREAKQHRQYRNRKAELDWDHAFDLDQIHLYTTQNDIDNHSLTSYHSSSDNSFSSV